MTIAVTGSCGNQAPPPAKGASGMGPGGDPESAAPLQLAQQERVPGTRSDRSIQRIADASQRRNDHGQVASDEHDRRRHAEGETLHANVVGAGCDIQPGRERE